MRKLVAVVKWFLITVPLGLFGIITAPILYPLFDLTKWKALWIYGDDKRINPDGSFYPDYKVFLIQTVGEAKETFWARYKWMGFRNRIWNLRTWIEFLQTGDGTGLTELETVIDDLTLDGKKVSDGVGKWKQEAGLKYLAEPGQNPWQVWSGDVIDFRYSIIGQSLIWFKQDGIFSFRYSYCKLWFGRWITIKINLVKSDTVLTLKFQKDSKESILPDSKINLDLAKETDWKVADNILVLINEYRVSIGLPALKKDKQHASAIAVEHTKYMMEMNRINHDNFGKRSEALKQNGAIRVGENVAYGYTNAVDVVGSWLLSPTHKRVIEGNFTHSGFGVIAKENGKYYFTQLFYSK